MDGDTLVEELRVAGLAAGLSAVGVTSAEVLEPARSELHRRKALGLHGTMQFTYRNPDRSTDPARLVAGARAIVVGAYAYRRAEPSTGPASDAGTAEQEPLPHGLGHRERTGAPGAGSPDHLGRVARYAWRDHYGDLAAGLEAIADQLRQRGWTARVVLDDNALVDRAAAWRAGLGWYGKNANILLPGAGSWFVLGGVVTDAPLPPTDRIVADGCGSCTRCLDGCPTGAIVAPGVVDARRCLAWLVQAPGWIPVEFRQAVGDRLYGCDDCQEVCPPNRVAERRGGTPLPEQDCQPSVDLSWLLDATDAEILGRLGRWYIPQRDPDHLRRNALVVLGNNADPADPWVLRTLYRYRRHPNPMVRAHAVWASRRLGHEIARDPDEEDPRVRAEWDHPVGSGT